MVIVVHYVAGMLLLWVSVGAAAYDVNLATQRARDGVQLTIYNAEDLTLVRETRRVSFRRGDNRLRFAWANTLIDPTSVQITFPRHADALSLTDTRFPHDQPRSLYWRVSSELDGEAPVEISYFTAGLTWQADYVAIADPSQMQVSLRGFVRVHNRSGAHYEAAQLRLVVGQINLVTPPAVLARAFETGGEALSSTPQRQAAPALKQRAVRRAMAADGVSVLSADAAPAALAAPKAVDLGDYFIYAVEGLQTLTDGWSQRLPGMAAATVAIRGEYRHWPERYGQRLMQVYRLNNDQASRLGVTPLPEGEVRILQRGADGGLRYRNRHAVEYVPIGGEMVLQAGVNPGVVSELAALRHFRDNIQFGDGNTGATDSAQQHRRHKHRNARVRGWDTHTVYERRVRNATNQPIRVNFRRVFPGDVRVRSLLDWQRHDHRTLQLTVEVAPSSTQRRRYEVIRAQGDNARQQRVRTVAGAPAATVFWD